ncbi:MAG: carboxypeptidase-like regulatory domain-containing protein, partial [Treponema sp.]|nr:carboxypeptidase-like regulatory domain-containing protein [Treponema sp.]
MIINGKRKKITQAEAIIIGALIGVAGGVIVGKIPPAVPPIIRDVSVVVRDRDTDVPVPRVDITVAGSNGKRVAQALTTVEGEQKIRSLEMDDYTVWARAVNYEEE